MNNKPNTTFSGSELNQLSAYKIVQLLRQGDISPTELVATSIKRIEQVEPTVNTTPTTCFERAIEDAKKWDQQPKQNYTRGHLSGLPTGIKDLSAVQGVRSAWGNMGLKDNTPEHSDYFVERLETRGAIVMGKPIPQKWALMATPLTKSLGARVTLGTPIKTLMGLPVVLP